jgi:acetate kinase
MKFALYQMGDGEEALGPAAGGLVVIAHLGNGASLAAVGAGRPLETTMGLTPTGGVMMGTRSGDLDPGVLLYLMRARGYDAARLEPRQNAAHAEIVSAPGAAVSCA